jgi:hypothetical protein
MQIANSFFPGRTTLGTVQKNAGFLRNHRRKTYSIAGFWEKRTP